MPDGSLIIFLQILRALCLILSQPLRCVFTLTFHSCDHPTTHRETDMATFSTLPFNCGQREVCLCRGCRNTPWAQTITPSSGFQWTDKRTCFIFYRLLARGSFYLTNIWILCFLLCAVKESIKLMAQNRCWSWLGPASATKLNLLTLTLQVLASKYFLVPSWLLCLMFPLMHVLCHL